tara:strand:- start:71 stop:1384 length:1314 start_codon:yes stop_codon:yes gene_type:complete
MGVHLRLVNHDELFRKATNVPIIVNQFDLQSQAHMEQLNELIYTTYNDDSLEIQPRCECGQVSGEFNVGVVCDNCGVPCLSVTERPLESSLWIASPQGVDRLINPEVWIILSKRLMDGGVSVLEWLTNPYMVVPPEKEPLSIKKLKEKGVPRGLNNFVRHFDEIMDLLINGKIIKNGKLEERQELMVFLKENRAALFCQHLPIPSKLAFITEKTPMGTYADPTMGPAVEAIRTISSIENSITPITQAKRESRAVKAIMQLAEYYETFFSKSLGPKPGWFRKHIYGSRVHFSFRAVISSISEPHDYEEVHLPWSMSVMFFKVHLISKLLKPSPTMLGSGLIQRGMTPNEALRYLHQHTLKYDPLLDEIFQELISESPYKGVPILLQRNPSLTRGSIQQLFVTKIKTDPKVNTIGLSVLILSAFNADFDGSMVAVAKVL